MRCIIILQLILYFHIQIAYYLCTVDNITRNYKLVSIRWSDLHMDISDTRLAHAAVNDGLRGWEERRRCREVRMYCPILLWLICIRWGTLLCFIVISEAGRNRHGDVATGSSLSIASWSIVDSGGTNLYLLYWCFFDNIYYRRIKNIQ